MITLVEALDFRCLKYIRRSLGPYQVLVGPNASGKTTFLDVISFLGSFVAQGLDRTMAERTANPRDLFWKMSGGKFELAVEAEMPVSLRNKIGAGDEYNLIRYEVSLGFNEDQEFVILRERGFFKKRERGAFVQKRLFPDPMKPPRTIIKDNQKKTRAIFNKTPMGNDNYYSEVYPKSGRGWRPSIHLGQRKSTYGNLIEEESKFPVAVWLKKLLTDGVQQFILNSLVIRKPSPPGQVRTFKTDGSNLPWVIDRLCEKHPDKFSDWIDHVKTALPDIEGITTKLKEDDYHRHLIVRYANGAEVPSWMVSDGTLRLLALTLPAYLPDFEGVYLIEEPENGIHPRAVETITQSLSSIYNAQVLVATHSPIVLSHTPPENVLCFAKNSEGATDVVSGDAHPALRDWRREGDLGVLFASGVLG